MINELFSLNGRLALITGGNSGIGEAIGQGLKSAGADVIIIGKNPEKTRKSCEINQFYDYFCYDLAQLDNIAGMIQEIQAKHTKIDILVNAAGVNLRLPIAEVGVKEWQSHLDLMLGAPFFLSKYLAKSMANNGFGRIINIASLQSTRAFANGAPYGAAKGGVVQLTRAIAQEYSAQGINCNAIGPGFFPTELTKKVFDDPVANEMHRQRTAIGRHGNLKDLWGIAIFLASPASSYITGQTIMLDGGYTAK